MEQWNSGMMGKEDKPIIDEFVKSKFSPPPAGGD
jgi:hypothetical protein